MQKINKNLNFGESNNSFSIFGLGKSFWSQGEKLWFSREIFTPVQPSMALPCPICQDFMQYIFGILEAYWLTLGRCCFWYLKLSNIISAYCDRGPEVAINISHFVIFCQVLSIYSQLAIFYFIQQSKNGLNQTLDHLSIVKNYGYRYNYS